MESSSHNRTQGSDPVHPAGSEPDLKRARALREKVRGELGCRTRWPQQGKELAGTDATYSDNFFPVRPGEPAQIVVHPAKPISREELLKCLKLRSLFDTYAAK